MIICLIYPLIYDGLQLKNSGFEYFSDPWNYLDLAHIYVGLLNLFVQRFEYEIINPYSQFLMCLISMVLLVKTFFFLRIWKELSFLVTMILQTMVELKGFLFFFAINILIYS